MRRTIAEKQRKSPGIAGEAAMVDDNSSLPAIHQYESVYDTIVE
jgi:hypothetical protein